VLQGEPLDLDACVTQRKPAWDASGIKIVREERRNNQGGLRRLICSHLFITDWKWIISYNDKSSMVMV
jgi:hypothetical protein